MSSLRVCQISWRAANLTTGPTATWCRRWTVTPSSWHVGPTSRFYRVLTHGGTTVFTVCRYAVTTLTRGPASLSLPCTITRQQSCHEGPTSALFTVSLSCTGLCRVLSLVFVVCQTLTYVLFGVVRYLLPCVAHGKKYLCRVPDIQHMSKTCSSVVPCGFDGHVLVWVSSQIMSLVCPRKDNQVAHVLGRISNIDKNSYN